MFSGKRACSPRCPARAQASTPSPDLPPPSRLKIIPVDNRMSPFDVIPPGPFPPARPAARPRRASSRRPAATTAAVLAARCCPRCPLLPSYRPLPSRRVLCSHHASTSASAFHLLPSIQARTAARTESRVPTPSHTALALAMALSPHAYVPAQFSVQILRHKALQEPRTYPIRPPCVPAAIRPQPFPSALFSPSSPKQIAVLLPSRAHLGPSAAHLFASAASLHPPLALCRPVRRSAPDSDTRVCRLQSLRPLHLLLANRYHDCALPSQSVCHPRLPCRVQHSHSRAPEHGIPSKRPRFVAPSRDMRGRSLTHDLAPNARDSKSSTSRRTAGWHASQLVPLVPLAPRKPSLCTR